jgi:cytochrome c-type biogenesis protein CcmE
VDVIDPESSDAATPTGSGADGLDLRPREVAPRPPRRRRGWLPIAVLVLVLVAAGYVVSKALTSASLFFYTADQAVAKRPELGSKNFRIEGTVLDDVHRTSNGADFHIVFNCVEVAVDHVGDPPALFKPGEPVVLEGHWDPSSQPLFDSDLMLVKHSGTYVSENASRLQKASQGGQIGKGCTGTSGPSSSP